MSATRETWVAEKYHGANHQRLIGVMSIRAIDSGDIIAHARHDVSRLITTAPEMLSELESILTWATTENAPLRDSEIQSIRALIAKAKGEE